MLLLIRQPVKLVAFDWARSGAITLFLLGAGQQPAVSTYLAQTLEKLPAQAPKLFTLLHHLMQSTKVGMEGIGRAVEETDH